MFNQRAEVQLIKQIDYIEICKSPSNTFLYHHQILNRSTFPISFAALNQLLTPNYSCCCCNSLTNGLDQLRHNRFFDSIAMEMLLIFTLQHKYYTAAAPAAPENYNSLRSLILRPSSLANTNKTSWCGHIKAILTSET